MQAYAYTRGCRRGFVLRYFGDPDAMDRCTGCDNCLGPKAHLLRDATPPRGPNLNQRFQKAASYLKSRLL
jgi:superfamily II DNA helicase RecQ